MRMNDYVKRRGHITADVVELDPPTLRKLQKTMLAILLDIEAYCAREGIEWTLGGGSVLGAARHSGFIPWDDDIDINMTRSQWLRFVEGFQREYADKYWIHAPNYYDKCKINAIRIYKKGTVLQEVSALESDAHGIFLDVFLLENAPNNKLVRLVHGVACMGLRYVCSCARLWEQRKHYEEVFGGDADAMKNLRKRIRIGGLASFFPVEKWVRISDRANGRFAKKKNARDFSIPTGARQYFGEVIVKSSYFPAVRLPFEGHDMPCPAKYDTYLTNLYGDWRTLPKDEERETHVLLALDFGDDGDATE